MQVTNHCGNEAFKLTCGPEFRALFSTMRLAVIIPCYNHAKYIGAALESVLAQSRRADRVIVIDDGSTDNSVEVIRSFGARGVEWVARENRGAHNTINELVGRASEDCGIISILNSDDHYHPQRFEKCLPLLESHPDRHVITSGLRVIDAFDANLDPSSPRAKWFRAVWSMASPERDLCEWLGVANFPATTSNIIARADWLRRFPFRPYRFNHDYYFLAQTVLRDAMLVHPEALVNYRVHGTNTMNTDPAPLLRGMLRMNFDLARDLAPELASDAGLRARFSRYNRAQWDSISSFHAGLYQMLLAGAAARLTEDEIEDAVGRLSPEHFPELATYPNKSLVNTWDESSPVTGGTGLTEKYEALRISEKEHKSRGREQKELAALRGGLADSRWLAFGRLLGFWKPPSIPKTSGKSPAQALRESLSGQAWIRLGRKLGGFPLGSGNSVDRR